MDKLDQCACLYLYVLYSLTEKRIEKRFVDECFLKCMKDRNDCNNSISDIIKLLEDSLVILENENGKVYMEVYHPSLNDYLKEKITLQEARSIISHAVYLERLESFERGPLEVHRFDHIKNILLDPKQFFQLEFLPVQEKYENLLKGNKPIIYAKYLNKYNIQEESLKDIVYLVALGILSSDIITLMIWEDTVINFMLNDFYDLKKVLQTDFAFQLLFRISSSDNALSLLKVKGCYTDGCLDYKKLKEQSPVISREITEKIIQKISEVLVDNISIDEEINNIKEPISKEWNDMNIDEQFLEVLQYIHDDFEEQIDNACKAEIKRWNLIHFEYDLEGLVDDIVSNHLYDIITDCLKTDK